MSESFPANPSVDYIHVNGIRAYGYTGFLAEERTLGQWFTVDLSLGIELSQAGATDRIEDTIDYRNVIQIVQDIIQNEKFALVERLAAVICDRLLTEVGVQQIKILLTKEAPPIPDFGGSITVELSRWLVLDR